MIHIDLERELDDGMTRMMPTTDSAQAAAAVLELTGPAGSRETRELAVGECLFAGSDATADLHLDGADVASVHCMIRAESGSSVLVRDCYSETGTIVNGQKVTERQVSDTSEVQIGEYRIRITLRNPCPAAPKGAVVSSSGEFDATKRVRRVISPVRPESKPDQSATAVDKVAGVSKPADQADVRAATSVSPDANAQHELRQELQRAHAEIEILRDRLQFASVNTTAAENETGHDEIVELLRAEVIELQAELAAQLETADDAAAIAEADTETISCEEAERLVQRLEQLLQELQQRDEQVALLTDLLEAAETASQAQEEERAHLDAWVSDIEQRFSQREQEWQAQLQQEQQRQTRLKKELQEAEASLAASASNAQIELLQRSLRSQRDEAEAVRKQLEQCEQERSRLQREVENLGSSVSREEAVRLSQERAELARMRQELEARCQTQEKPRSAKEPDERFQALRQHLKDIHQQEEQQRQQRSLSSRLARLWNRLE